jgi:sn-glycerol 3-phosphate transport system substrate-binding protein
MSRLWTLVGVAVLALAAVGLAACSENDGDEEAGGAGNEAEPTASGLVTIDFWHSESAANGTTLEGLVERFNASQDQVRVRPLYQGNVHDLVLKLVNSLPSGNVPALVELVEGNFQIAVDSGGVTPVQQFIDAEGYDLSDFDEKLIDYYTLDGKLYAMPWAVSVPLLLYNKIPFREVGLDPDKPPLTLDDVRVYSEKLLKVDSAGNVIRSGLALDTDPWWLAVTLAAHGDLFLNNNNGRDGPPTEVLFNGANGQAFFRWWDEMIDRGLAFNVGRNLSGADALMAVAAGRAVMAFTSSSVLRSVFEVLEAGVEGVELGVGPFPTLAGGTNEPGFGSRSLWIMNKRSEAEQRAAWQFVRWLAEPEQQAELFAGTGNLPARTSAYDLEPSRQVMEEHPEYQVPVDSFVGVPSTPAKLGPRMGPGSMVSDILAEAIEEMVVGGEDPIQALDDAAERATAELQEYNRRVGE